jgi:hypothetical protein
MDEKVTYWASVAFGALALVLLVLNVSFVNGNRALQEEVSQRQATINRSPTLGQIDQGIVQALANAAIKDDDAKARDLLAAQGITIKPGAGADASATATPDNAKPAKTAAERKKKLDKVNEEILP